LDGIDFHFILNRLKPPGLQRDFSDAHFYAYFPVTGSTEKKAVFDIQKSLPSRFTETIIAGDQPKEGMGV
jgi:hypothetical protein